MATIVGALFLSAAPSAGVVRLRDDALASAREQCAGRCTRCAGLSAIDGVAPCSGRGAGAHRPLVMHRFVRLLAGLLAVLLLPLAVQAKTLRVVSDDNYPPYLFLNPDRVAEGYLVDLWKLWERKTGIPVELVAIRWADAQQRVLAGDADVIDMIYRTPAREPKYDFSEPYADLPVLIYASTAITGLHDVGSLKGFTVGVQEGDACIETLEKGDVSAMVRFPNYEALIRAALRSEVRIFCLDESPANYYLYRLDPERHFHKAFELYRGRFHRAVRKGDTETLAMVERGMALVTDAERAALRGKWFGSEVPTVFAPWVRYAGYALVVLAGVLLVLLTWVQTMRAAVRRKTAALGEERARFETLFQTLPDAVWLKDPSGVMLACNSAFERLFGRPQSELVGRTDAQFMGEAMAAGFRESDERAMAADRPLHQEEWLDFPTVGSPRLFRTTKTRMRDAGGRLIGVLGVGRDVTEQHTTQMALAERIKEQTCHAAVIRASENLDTPLPDMLLDVARHLPPGWVFPEIAVADIEWAGAHYPTGDMAAAVDRLSADIRIDGEVRGRVTVAYTEARPRAYEGPFLIEERHLIETVAERLASVFLRRAAEDRLRDSEERFRKVFEDTRQAITLIEDGRFVAANAASLAMLRFDRLEDFLGRTPADISPPFQPDGQSSTGKAASMVRATFETGSQQFEWEHLRADGEQFTARVLTTAIRQGGRDLLHVVWSDITAQKRAEAELAEYRHDLERKVAERTAEVIAATESLRVANEERRAVFDAANVGIVLTRDSVIVHCNRTLERLLGREAGELAGRRTRIWYGSDAECEEVGARIDADIQRQGFHREEIELTRKDGSRFWVRLMVQAFDRDHPEAGVAGTIEDITAERAAIAEMARARELAEDAARTKSDFLANMSHEIRTPMNAVIGMTHLVLETELTPRQREYVQKIQSSSRMLLGILNDILDFSKIDAGKLVVERIDFELDRVLDNVAAMVAERTAGKGLELIIDVAADVPNNLVGDPLRIGQILTNYANNAVKFTEQGEIAIRVEIEGRDADEVRLRFAVRDTGIGIDEQQRARLFRSFEQADTSITRKYGGTGLGLVISKRLAELMGGTVGVDSASGKGSTFWFTVVLGTGRESRERLLPRADLRGRRVLVVDDNEHAREITAEHLRGMTFVVSAAASGDDALAELLRAEEAHEPHEIVFLDWHMPGMDGLETAAEIGRLGLGQAPHLLMVTAYGRDDLAASARGVGIEEVLTKPVTASQLFDAAMRVLGAGEAARHRPQPDEPVATREVSALAGARVLLVEDNDLNQEVATEFLHELGLEVDLAPDGAVALEKLKANTYDIVLMDMQMPVMDGLTATREIRKMPGLRDLPIVAMTANVMAADRERCIDAGMNDHIAKPIVPATLVAKLVQWVRPRSDRMPAQEIPVAAPASSPLTVSAHVLDGIPGLDVARGLSLVMNRDALYLSIMEKFVDGQADAPVRIGAAIAAADWPTAEREAHTLKGVSAQIGAEPVRSMTEQLERAIRGREPVARLEELLAGIGSVLGALVGAIAERLPKAAPVVAASSVDPAALRELCVRLAGLLRDDDFASGKLLGDNAAMLRAAFGDRYREISEAVRQYDFAIALDRLERAADSLGIAFR